MTLHASTAIKVRSSHKVCLNHLWIILHASIAFRPWSSFKDPPTLHIGYFKATLHVDIAFKVALFTTSFILITHGLF